MTDRKSTHLTIGLVSVLLALFLFGFVPRIFQTRKVDNLADKVPPVEVTIQVAKPDDTANLLMLPSVTQALHVTPVLARTTGYLANYNVDIGDVVKTGQVLAVIETPEVDQQYAEAQSAYENAKVQNELAKNNADRAKSLFSADARAISKIEYDQFIAAYLSSQEQVIAQEANMKRIRDLKGFQNIIAPFDGIITERRVNIGTLITTGTTELFKIAATDVLRVFVQVPQYYYRSISEGIEATTTIREFEGQKFTSVVSRYAKALDPISHTMLAELHINNKDNILTAGLYADVTFSLSPSQDYYIVPTPAVIIRQGYPKIAILDDQNKAHLKEVAIGLDYGKTMQIISGLTPGDRIITNPTEKVKEGVECVIHQPKPST
ncbi:MAG: efflux RND transporter periplasmic adaptor subunit [Chlamydiales bacterium]|nr:efflux RND transporter periplasmic adaptor subunit [Chlamydiales bacterium]